MSFITRLHTDLRHALLVRRGATTRPEYAVRGECKEYPRMPRIRLPKPERIAMPLGEALFARASLAYPDANRPFAQSELGTLLGSALGMRSEHTRTYPSGGALYPIETYLVGDVLEGSTPSVFHYHPKEHALEHLWEIKDFAMDSLLRGGLTPLTNALVVFTATWNRSAAKYGDWAYNLALLEAGHMAQNVLLCATALGIKARPIGGFDDDAVADLLELDERECAIYSVQLSGGDGAKGGEPAAIYE